MANWKKVIVSGSQAQLNQLSVDTSVNITGSLSAASTVKLTGLTNASQATIVGIDATTGQLYYQGTGSFTANSASYAKNADTASSADNFTVRQQAGIGTAPVGTYPLYVSSSASDASVGIDSSAAVNAMYFLKGGNKKFEISFDTSTDGIFRLLPYSSSTFFEIGNPSNAGADYVFVSEKTYGNVMIGPGISNGAGSIGGALSTDKVQVKGNLYVSGSTRILGGLTVQGLTPVSASYLVGYNPTTGALSYTGTGSVVSVTSSFAVSASHANNADNALTASKVTNVLTQGKGIEIFTYDGSAPESVEISGSLGLSTNIITKWSGDAFVNSSITDSTKVTINNNGGVYIQAGGLDVSGSSVFHNNVVMQGNLVVNGTASFQNTTNLEVADQFILLNSGSSTFQDSGIVINTGNSGNSGSAWYLETSGTTVGSPQNGRFAVAAGVAPNATTASPANSTSSAAAKNTSAEKPATGPGTVNLEGEYKKNADSWVAAVQSGKSFDSVPDMYKPYVKAQLAKGTPKSKPVTTATPTSPPGNAPTASTPSSSTPPPKVETAATPQKKELTAQEKAAVYETIATNTKYTADLMQSQIRAINSMAQQLAAITEATRDTATAAKKTAQRVN